MRISELISKNYRGLVDGRKVTIVDATAFVSDPEKSPGLRSHKGSHHQTMSDLVKPDNFAEVHEPLRGLSFDEKNLVINPCKVGRHRSMGNAEMQLPTLASILYENDKSRIGSVHLQSLTDWKGLCPVSCTHCKINGLAYDVAGRNSKDHLECMGSAYKLLSAIIPMD